MEVKVGGVWGSSNGHYDSTPEAHQRLGAPKLAPVPCPALSGLGIYSIPSAFPPECSFLFLERDGC